MPEDSFVHLEKTKKEDGIPQEKTTLELLDELAVSPEVGSDPESRARIVRKLMLAMIED